MFLLKYTFLLTKRTNFLKKFKNQSYFNSIKKKNSHSAENKSYEI